MPSNLDPKTLQALRNEKHLSQAELAVKCDCTPETVGRWERGKAKVAQQRFKDCLCEALGVPWEALCRPYQRKNEITSRRAVDDGREQILRNLNARVSHQAHLAFTLASQRYGVRIADIVELAPLLFMVAAEQSLADRQKKVDSLVDAFGELEAIRDELPQISAAILLPDVDEIIESEAASIARREAFGCEHWEPGDWDSPDIDPFGNYLRGLIEATELSPGLIDSIGRGFSEGPSYQLGIDALKAITGLTDETEHERTALSHIKAGDLDFRELLAKRKSLSVGDFQEWLPGWVDSFDETCLD